VSAGSTKEIGRVTMFAASRSVKFTHIVLDGGSRRRSRYPRADSGCGS
jgi:hypothetical protein